MASYRFGVTWIAENDEPTCRDQSEVEDQISVMLLADLFGKPPARVAADVIARRNELAFLRAED